MKRAFIKKPNKNQLQKGKGKVNNRNKPNKNNDKVNQPFDDANDY
jgi:hypothetical protein